MNRDKEGRTPAQIAAENKRKPLVAFFKEMNAKCYTCKTKYAPLVGKVFL